MIKALLTDLSTKINNFYLPLILDQREIMDTTFIQAKDFIQIYETEVCKNGTFSNVD